MLNGEIRLETERLVMRPFISSDESAAFNIMKDEELFKYTPDEPWKSIEDAKEFIKLALWLYGLEHETFRHFFAITEKNSEKLIGICGVGGVEYDRTENEVFYHIGKEYWGKGYATEAAKAVLRYAFMQLGLDKVIGVVHPENIASCRVLEKIGLKSSGTISGLPDEYSFYNGEYLYLLKKAEYIE